MSSPKHEPSAPCTACPKRSTCAEPCARLEAEFPQLNRSRDKPTLRITDGRSSRLAGYPDQLRPVDEGVSAWRALLERYGDVLPDAIGSLSSGQRVVIERMMEGASQTQVAADLGVSRVAVGRRLRRAYAALADRMAAEVVTATVSGSSLGRERKAGMDGNRHLQAANAFMLPTEWRTLSVSATKRGTLLHPPLGRADRYWFEVPPVDRPYAIQFGRDTIGISISPGKAYRTDMPLGARQMVVFRAIEQTVDLLVIVKMPSID